MAAGFRPPPPAEPSPSWNWAALMVYGGCCWHASCGFTWCGRFLQTRHFETHFPGEKSGGVIVQKPAGLKNRRGRNLGRPPRLPAQREQLGEASGASGPLPVYILSRTSSTALAVEPRAGRLSVSASLTAEAGRPAVLRAKQARTYLDGGGRVQDGLDCPAPSGLSRQITSSSPRGGCWPQGTQG